MKYRVLAVIVFLIAILTLTVSAAGYEYSVTPNDTFIYARQGDDLTQISKKLNMTNDELKAYFNQNGLIYLAISDNTESQIKISVYSDEFSSTVNDISLLDDITLAQFAESLDENGGDIIVNKDRKFICVKHTLNDSGGEYTVTQYVTICNNKTFYFAGYNSGKDTSPEIVSAFKSFELSESKADSPSYTLPLVFVIIGIIIFSVIAIIMLISIIKFKTKKSKELNQIE